MKTHFIFCCNNICKQYMIGNYMENNAAIIHNRSSVILNGERYRFIVDVNNNVHQIMGMDFEDYRMCEHYFILAEVRYILEARRTRCVERENRDMMSVMTDDDLICAFNRQVGNKGWGSSKASFLESLCEEIKRRYDYSAISVGGIGMSFKRRIKLVGNKIELDDIDLGDYYESD